MAHAVKRVTFGDAGRIAYVVYVDSAGTAVHPPRILFTSPEVREFAAPIRATYPPSYNPPYWMQGLQPHFSWKTELQALGTTSREYLSIFWGLKEYLVALLALLVAWPAVPKVEWPILLPPIAAFGLYAAVGHVESRLAGAFVTLLLLPIFAGLRVRPKHKKIVQFAVILVLVVTVFTTLRASAKNPYSATHVQWETATALRRMGLTPGTQVAYFGHTTEALYWARLAGLRVAADIQKTEMPKFWSASPAIQKEILARVAEVGIRAVVTSNAPPVQGWISIPGTPYSVCLLSGGKSRH